MHMCCLALLKARLQLLLLFKYLYILQNVLFPQLLDFEPCFFSVESPISHLLVHLCQQVPLDAPVDAILKQNSLILPNAEGTKLMEGTEGPTVSVPEVLGKLIARVLRV